MFFLPSFLQLFIVLATVCSSYIEFTMTAVPLKKRSSVSNRAIQKQASHFQPVVVPFADRHDDL